jgi:hypothetical protein
MDMSDQNTTANGQATDQARDAAPAKLYATKAECEAAKPADAPKSLRVYEVAKSDTVVGFLLGRGYDSCLAALARKEGYTVSVGGRTAEIKLRAK